MESLDVNVAVIQKRSKSKPPIHPEFLDNALTGMFRKLAPHLDERQCRLMLAAEAQVLGWGGISKLAEVTSIFRATIQNGLRGLETLRKIVRVCQDHDTATLAVGKYPSLLAGERIANIPRRQRIANHADGGGGNGSRVRLWKYDLARLETDSGSEEPRQINSLRQAGWMT